MSEIIVAYWSGTGNTGAMAEYVAQGIREGGKEAKIVNVENFSADELKDCSVFALGCPSMATWSLSCATLTVSQPARRSASLVPMAGETASG